MTGCCALIIGGIFLLAFPITAAIFNNRRAAREERARQERVRRKPRFPHQSSAS